MIDLDLTVEQESLIATVQGFAHDRVEPVARQLDDSAQLQPDLLARLHDMGVHNPVPLEYGGQGLIPGDTWLAVLEQLAGADPGLAYTVAMSSLGVRLIADVGSETMKRRLLPEVAADPTFRLSTAVLEGYGRRPHEFVTTADRAGGQLRVTGSKVAVLWPGAASATLVVATDGPGGSLSAFLIESPARLMVERDDQVVGKLGMRSAPTGDVTFLQAQATPVSDGRDDPLAVLRVVEEGRLALAAICVGLADASIRYAAEYATQREAFGQTISSYQGISFPLAELQMRNNAARLTNLQAITEVGSAESAQHVGRQVSQALVYAANVAVDASRVGINTLGGHGYLQDHPVERWYRAASTIAALTCDPLLLELEVL